MATTNGATKSGPGADRGVTRVCTSTTDTGGALSTARQRWMEAERAYRAAATHALAVDEGPVETLRKLRDLAKAAEDAYCEALVPADPIPVKLTTDR